MNPKDKQTVLRGGVNTLREGPSPQLKGAGKMVDLSGMPRMLPNPLNKNDLPFFLLLVGGAIVVYLTVAGELRR